MSIISKRAFKNKSICHQKHVMYLSFYCSRSNGRKTFASFLSQNTLKGVLLVLFLFNFQKELYNCLNESMITWGIHMDSLADDGQKVLWLGVIMTAGYGVSFFHHFWILLLLGLRVMGFWTQLRHVNFFAIMTPFWGGTAGLKFYWG